MGSVVPWATWLGGTRRSGWSAGAALGGLAGPLLAALAYGLGSQIGFWFRFPQATTSILWPPNAILTATLLLTAPRRWGVYLLAVLPVHFALQATLGWPPLFILTMFATNCSEALLAGWLVRRFSDAPARFDTLHRVVVFIVAAVAVAPLVTTFADAGAVAVLRGEPYWLVWHRRLLSNMVAALAVVPVVVTGATLGARWLRGVPPRRVGEMALLLTGLVVVGRAVFAVPGLGLAAIPGTPHTPRTLLLPLLMWGAVRLGPAAASLGLLTTALIATWSSTHGGMPFSSLPPSEGVLALQVFLCVTGIPLLCLAALTEERRATTEVLRKRLQFEALLARLSASFAHLPSHRMDVAFQTALQELGEFLALDRVGLLRLTEGRDELITVYSWAGTAARQVPASTSKHDLPWCFGAILRDEVIAFSRPDQLPPDAVRDRETLERRGVTSGLFLALKAGGEMLGGLTLATLGRERAWDPEQVQRLRLVAELMANALARKETEDALRASEGMKSSILASLASRVAVLDRGGRIIAVNESWTRFTRECDLERPFAVGASYLEGWQALRAAGAPEAAEILAGAAEVLGRAREGFTLDYPCHVLGGERWFALVIVPLKRSEGGVVVSHTEITERRRAEMEAQTSRQELAHFLRVSTMGLLATSLAHELNQPLTAILANAQAARRLLKSATPDIQELGEIVSDMIAEDERAAGVIRRLRGLLKKGETNWARQDLNWLLREVIRLVRNDSLIRKVVVRPELDGGSLPVDCDSIQIQQVVLNLLLNAMDAVGGCAPEHRSVVVRSGRLDARTAQVSIEDSGVGLQDGNESRVFEPFYSTKPDGMGMGLSIARSIVQAHGGAIWARNNPARGASFGFALPLAP